MAGEEGGNKGKHAVRDYSWQHAQQVKCVGVGLYIVTNCLTLCMGRKEGGRKPALTRGPLLLACPGLEVFTYVHVHSQPP